MYIAELHSHYTVQLASMPHYKLPYAMVGSISHLIHSTSSPHTKWHLHRFSHFCIAQ